MKRLLIIFNLFLTLNIFAQDIHPNGKFLSDSVKIGQPVKFSLSVFHSPESQILFPDSGYSFSPFELIKKEYFTTSTRDHQSFDSAVYILRTFTLDSSLRLSLPVFVARDGDSTAYFTSSDTIFLKQYLPEIPLDIQLKEQTNFKSVPLQINYPYYIAYTAIALFVGLIFYFFFGKSIRRRYKLFIVRSDYIGFINNYQILESDFVNNQKVNTIERALSLWKAYHARLENTPINTYTTTEIINLYNRDDLKDSLNVIDRAIYGGLISEDAERALSTLKKFSNRQYHIRKREIQNV